jgi:hypothetical protein
VAKQRGEQRLADVGEIVSDDGLPPGVPGEYRLAELGIGREQCKHEVQWLVRERGVLLHRHEPGTGHPDQARGLGPLHQSVEVDQFLAGLGLEDPVADLLVERVAGAKRLHQVAGVDETEASGLRELAPVADPGQEGADLADEFRFLGGGV